MWVKYNQVHIVVIVVVHDLATPNMICDIARIEIAISADMNLNISH